MARDTADPRLKVLVVDDDEIPRMIAAEALTQCGYDVIEAADGEEALAQFRVARPDLVLLDVLMPGRDGFDVCRELRRMPRGREVPILVMTGLDDEGSIDRAYDAGATDFVTKPVNNVLLGHRARYLSRASHAFRMSRENGEKLAEAQRLARLARWELRLEDGHFRWSEEARELFGVTELDGTLATALLPWVDAADRSQVAHACERAAPHSLEYRASLADGRLGVFRQDATVVLDVDGAVTGLRGTTQDITELRKVERQVHDLAYFDTLTRLPNRAQLRAFLDRALAEAGTRFVAVLTLDLDGFKAVNDSLGHAGGDELLCEVARRLSRSVRGTDHLSFPPAARAPGQSRDVERDAMEARFGGDEFVVVLKNLPHADAAAIVAQRIVERLAGTYRIGGSEVFVSSSVGIATYPRDAGTADELIDRADIAMYSAKRGGRNQYQVYAPAMEEAARRRVALEQGLRAAIAQLDADAAGPPAGGTLALVYQPKVELPSQEVLGVEALLRWTLPGGIPVSPADFIPIAEETGLIVPLGAWVLRAACTQARTWSMARRRGLRVAVNVSARQFREAGFCQLVRDVLAETELEPSLLELEITEGVLMEDTITSRRTLDELKSIGVRIALDDFGTGYSSLSYLSELPVDALKIDRSFVRRLGGDGNGETLTAAIIALSRSLGLDVVVEGVEREEQLAFVRRQGEVEVQGFIFARPMDAIGVDEWIEEHRSRSRASAVLVA